MSDQSEEARASEGAERLRQENAELLARAAALDAEWEELHAANLEEYMRPFVLDDDRRMAYRAFYGAGFGEDLTAREHANRVLAKGQALAQRPVHIRDLGPQDVILAKDAANARKIKVINSDRPWLSDESYSALKFFEPPVGPAGNCARCGHDNHWSPVMRMWSLEKNPVQWQGESFFDLVAKCAWCDGRTRDTRTPTFGYASPWLIASVVAQCFRYDPDEPPPNDELLDIGFEVRPGTMSLWCRDVAEAAKPVYELLYQQTKAAAVLGVMQTTVRLLPVEPQRDARIWMMADVKPHSPQVFDFTFGKSQRPPAKMFGDYKGKVVALAFRGPDGVELDKGTPRLMALNEVFGLLEDAETTHPDIYEESRRLLEALNELEANLEGEALLAARRGQGCERLAALRALLVRWQSRLAATHPHAVRIDQVLRQWEWVDAFMNDEALVNAGALAVADFLLTPALYPDSFFVGTQRGCETAAVLATLVTTCRVIGMRPDAYFAQMLLAPEEVAAHPEQWLPQVFIARFRDMTGIAEESS